MSTEVDGIRQECRLLPDRNQVGRATHSTVDHPPAGTVSGASAAASIFLSVGVHS